jgi:amino acid transporter
LTEEKPIEEVAERIAQKSDKKLRKALTLQDLFFLSMGGIIGSGWLLGVAGGASIAGPASVVSWIIGGIIVLFIALVFAEIAGAIPKSGSIVRYPHLAYGSYAGFILSWAYLLSAVTVPTVEAEAVLSYASVYIPNLFYTVTVTTPTGTHPVSILTGFGIFLGMILLVAFFFLNYAGIKFLGKFNTVATWWKFIIPTLTFLLLLAIFQKSNFTITGFAPYGWNNVFYAIPAGGIVFAYLGFRQALEFGGEAKNPQRDIPRATIYSVIAAILLYTLLQVAFIGALKWTPSEVGNLTPGSWSSITNAPVGSAPFFTEFKYSGLAALVAFSYFLLIDAWISPSGTGWIYLGNGGRVLYGIAADGYLPKKFLDISERTRVPWVALIAALIIGFIFFLPFPSWYLFVGFISSATVLTYVIGPIALHSFRKHAPEIKRPFKLPGASIIAPIGFIGAGLIVYWAGLATLTLVFGAVFIGLSFFYLFYAPSKLKLSKGYSYAVGLIILITMLFTTYWSYAKIDYPPPNETYAQNLQAFLLVYILDLIIIIGTTVATYSKVSQEYKAMFKSSTWLLALIFVTFLVSYFGSFGVTTIVPTAPQISFLAFPYDTVVMIVILIIIYVMGLRAGYKTEDLQAIIDEQTNPAEVLE